MKIHKVVFKDYRPFRGLREVSFLDPLTGSARPVTVLVGTNGSGKTTILETIAGALKAYAPPTFPLELRRRHGRPLPLAEFDLVTLSLSDGDLGGRPPKGSGLTIIPGRIEYPEPWSEVLGRGKEGNIYTYGLATVVTDCIEDLSAMDAVTETMKSKQIPLYGGICYFPHVRDIVREARPGERLKGPTISPQTESEGRERFFRYQAKDQWQGSLEEFWLWQNYLDLEAGETTRDHLGPFVSIVEDALGENRKITVKQGRVRVPPAWAAREGSNEQVLIDQLPSGERQVLLLFGEIARRLRRGAVIMIDEPEISLHPTLQLLVVDKLRRLAREWDLQVILATHSTEIVSAVSPSEIVNLDHLPSPGRPQPVGVAQGARG